MARRATKSPSRVELRRQVEAAEALEESEGKKKVVKKKATKRKTTRRKTAKKVDSQRLRLVWGVFDNSNQQVATFPYRERAEADKKAEEMTEKGRGPYFVQPVKEPIEEEIADEEDSS